MFRKRVTNHAVRTVDAATFRQLVAESDGPVIVDFFASWCAPCRAIGPHVAALAESHPVTVVKVDVDAEPELAAETAIRSIPTVVRYDGGRERARVMGYARREDLEARLHLA